MNDTDKRRLTVFLGEKWEDVLASLGDIYPCTIHGNRTFITPQDVFDLKDRLVEKGMWDGFSYYTLLKWEDGTPASPKEIRKEFIPWLFRPVDESGEPHFARLVSEFLEGRK